MTRLELIYTSFEDYMQSALSRVTRKGLRRKFKDAAAAPPIEMSVLQDITPLIDEVYPLYLQVYERSVHRFEKLTPEYLCEIGRRMPDKARFFVWRQQGKVVAFNFCMVHADTLHDEYIGLDYSVALDLHLYFYTFRDVMNWAIANGYRWYVSNGLNYQPKRELHCRLEPLDIYTRHTSSIINVVLKWVLPWLEPTRYDETLRRFPNFHELRA
jgi:predicted N-acyltransferase